MFALVAPAIKANIKVKSKINLLIKNKMASLTAAQVKAKLAAFVNVNWDSTSLTAYAEFLLSLSTGAEISLGATGGKIGMFGATPVVRGIVTTAAPTDTDTLITQVDQLKAALGQTAGIGAITLG